MQCEQESSMNSLKQVRKLFRREFIGITAKAKLVSISEAITFTNTWKTRQKLSQLKEIASANRRQRAKPVQQSAAFFLVSMSQYSVPHFARNSRLSSRDLFFTRCSIENKGNATKQQSIITETVMFIFPLVVVLSNSFSWKHVAIAALRYNIRIARRIAL